MTRSRLLQRGKAEAESVILTIMWVSYLHGVFLSPFRDLLICLLTLEEAEVQYENDY